MFEELIEIVAKLKHDGEWEGRFAYNLGVRDAINIIKQSEPPILDEPDSEGWWWRYNEYYIESVYVGGGLPEGLSCSHNGKLVYTKDMTGTWQKAIVPMEVKE